MTMASFFSTWKSLLGILPELRKLKRFQSNFCLISEDLRNLGILDLVLVSVMSSYWMLQSGKLTAFTVSELFRDNQQWQIKPPTQITVRMKRNH